MVRRVVVRESGNGFVCTLQVLNDERIQIFEKEMLVVGRGMADLGETVVELFKYRIRDRKKKEEPMLLAGCSHGKVLTECPICYKPQAEEGEL